MPPKSIHALQSEARRASHEADRVAYLRRKGLVEIEDYATAAIAEVRAIYALQLAQGKR